VDIRPPQEEKRMKKIFAFILSLFGVKRREVASPTHDLLKLNLQFFKDGVDDGGIADPGGGDPPTDPIDPPVVDDPPTDPPTDDLDQSKAFAKRLEERTQKALQEARQQWEQETSQKYGNYDQYQQSMEYVMKSAGYNNFDEFQQALQEAQLAERAEQNGIDPEFQSRVELLEQRAQRADELEQQREQEQVMQQFQSALNDFSKEKGIEATELESFMMDNQIPNFEMAYRAMKYEQMESDLQNAKDVAVKEYLESKKAPKVEGSGAPGVVKQDPPKNFAEARERALERLRSAGIKE
jgi:hypothetical protein